MAASAALVVAGLVAEHVGGGEAAARVLFVAAIAVGGVNPVREAVAVLRSGRLSIGVRLVRTCHPLSTPAIYDLA